MIAYLEKYDATAEVPDNIGEKDVADLNQNFPAYMEQKEPTQAVTPGKIQTDLPVPKWQPNLYEGLIKPTINAISPVIAPGVEAAVQAPGAKAFAGKAIEEGSFGLIKPSLDQEYQDHPAMAAAGEMAGGVGSLLVTGGALRIAGLGAEAGLAGKAAVEAGFTAGERFIPRAIMTGATFGTRTFIAETVKAFEQGGVNLEQFGKDVLKDTAFGAMFGSIGGMTNAAASVSSAGALGFISSKMSGADNREASLNAAIWGAFEAVGSVGRSTELRLEALRNLKGSIGEYVSSREPGIPPEQANGIASQFVDNAVRKAGYPTAEAIAKSGPENLLEGIEKVNQMVRKAQIPHPWGAPAEPLPKLPATVSTEAPVATPEAQPTPKTPLDKAVDLVKGIMGLKEPEKPPEAAAPAVAPQEAIQKGMKEISDRLAIHGITEPEKEAIFGHYAENLPDLMRQPIEQQYQNVYKELADARGLTKPNDARTQTDAERAVDLINGYFNPKSQEVLDFAKAHPEALGQDVAQMAYNRDLLPAPDQDLMMNELQKAKQEKIPTHPMLSESGQVTIPPDLVDVAEGIRSMSDEISRLVTPANAAPLAASITREQLGKMARSYDKAEASLSDASKLFEKQPKEANIDFIDKMERGQPQTDPRTQKIADTLRDLLDTKRDEIRALGTGKLKNFIENYFPHIWDQGEKEVGEAVQKAAKRPFEGSKAFLKARSIEFTKEGIEAGLTPVSFNPVDLTLLKLREMDKYVMAHRTINEYKENGLAKFVKVGADVPDGWIKIDDRISTVMFKGNQGLTISGHIYAQPDAARIINNYLSPGLGKSEIYQAYRFTANAMVRARLGLSAFHAGFMTLNSFVNEAALAVNQLMLGHPMRAAITLATLPAAPLREIIMGNKLRQAWFGKGGSDFYERVATMAASGGARARMDQFYVMNATNKMKQFFQTGRPLKGLLSLPFNILEKLSKPIMEHLVPTMKFGAIARIAEMEMAHNPNMTHQQMLEWMGRAVDSVDNRMGQLTYDNLFWNRTFKDVLMSSFQSVGWHLGEFREAGGAVSESGQFVKRILSGDKPKAYYKLGYAMVYPYVVGLFGAMLMKIMTGKNPQTLKDYFYPQTGGLDENGNPHRVALPSYAKDFVHLTDHPVKTVTDWLNPLPQTLAQMLDNKDYYGVRIRNQDDPLIKQVGFEIMHFLKQWEPFSLQNMVKNRDTGNKSLFDTIGPWVGITPAPYDINQTNAERTAHEIAASHQEIGGRTEEQFQRSKLLSELTRQYKLGNPDATTNLYKAYQEGLISHRQMQEVILHAGMTPLQRMVKGMSLDEAERVYSKANDEEKAQLEVMLAHKRANREREFVRQ